MSQIGDGKPSIGIRTPVRIGITKSQVFSNNFRKPSEYNIGEIFDLLNL